MSNKLDTLIDFSNKTHIDKLQSFISPLDGKHWVTIKKYRKNRSKEANSYYWVCVIRHICEFHGYDPDIKENRDKIHEDLKKQFNSVELEFQRKAFSCSLGDSILEYNSVVDYLEKRDWKPDVYNGKILLPLHCVRNIPERFEFGEEVVITDYESRPVSTTGLDTAEFYKYIERIRDYYAHNHNLYIPEPDHSGSSSVSEFDEMYSKL